MSTTSERRPKLTWSVKIRLLLTMGLAIGVGATGTMALWTATATANPGVLKAASLDVTVNDELSGVLDGTVTVADWAIADLLPGESIAISFTAANNGTGSIPLDVRLNAYATGALGSGLRFTFFEGGAVTNTGSLTGPASASYRSGACTGGTQIGAASQPVGASAAAATVVDATKRNLPLGDGFTYCVVVALDANAAAALSDGQGTVAFVVRATQEGAP